MDVWAGSVALGSIICADRVYTALCIKDVRFGMGASEMASGRKPSMDRNSTQRARGAGVGVKVGVEVAVAGGVAVCVAVCVTVGVSAIFGV